MGISKSRSNTRSLIGLSAVSLAIAAIITFAPRPSQPEQGWQPPTDYAIVDTISLEDGRTLRLWTGPSGWYVESLASGRHQGAVGAASGGDQYSVSEILDGLVGYLPTTGAQAVSVGSPASVRADVHSGVFLVPASVIGATDRAVSVTPLDANGKALAPETPVAVAGRG